FAPVALLALSFYRGCVEACWAESHAATVRQSVITTEKAMGRTKRNFQLTIVMAAKQRANAHEVPRSSVRLAGGRLPSCQANIAAKMSCRQKQQENSGDSIHHGCFHVRLQRSRQQAPPLCRVGTNCTTTAAGVCFLGHG